MNKTFPNMDRVVHLRPSYGFGLSMYSPDTQVAADYMTLWFDNGKNPSAQTYSYVLLPNKSSQEVSDYAGNPDIAIPTNTDTVQAVQEKSLGIVGANFWSDSVQSVGGITSNRKASVMTKKTPTSLKVAVSDPTMLNTSTIQLEIAEPAMSVVSSDTEITVTQLAPTVIMSVYVNGAAGKSFHIELKPPILNDSFDADSVGNPPTGWTIVNPANTSTTVAALPDNTNHSVLWGHFNRDTDPYERIRKSVLYRLS